MSASSLEYALTIRTTSFPNCGDPEKTCPNQNSTTECEALGVLTSSTPAQCTQKRSEEPAETSASAAPGLRTALNYWDQ
eukprot:6166014-Amphidinium_carterae.1